MNSLLLYHAVGRLLERVSSNGEGTFACFGQLPDAPLPGLEIAGLGPVGLPLHDHEAARTIAAAELAPFGKGDQTVVDLAVRSTWQIDISRVTLQNPTWTQFFKEEVMNRVCRRMGTRFEQTEAHLYKLLLYSTGGHFDKHQE